MRGSAVHDPQSPRREQSHRITRRSFMTSASAASVLLLPGCNPENVWMVADYRTDDSFGFTVAESRVFGALARARSFLQEIANSGNRMYGPVWFEEAHGGKGYGDALLVVKSLIRQWTNADYRAKDVPIDPAVSASLTEQSEAILEEAYNVSLAACGRRSTRNICDIDITTRFKAPGSPGGAPDWVSAWWDFSSP